MTDAIRNALVHAADQVEKLAFAIPPPNEWTPQFIMLAQGMRTAALSSPSSYGEGLQTTAKQRTELRMGIHHVGAGEAITNTLALALLDDIDSLIGSTAGERGSIVASGITPDRGFAGDPSHGLSNLSPSQQEDHRPNIPETVRFAERLSRETERMSIVADMAAVGKDWLAAGDYLKAAAADYLISRIEAGDHLLPPTGDGG